MSGEGNYLRDHVLNWNGGFGKPVGISVIREMVEKNGCVRLGRDVAIIKKFKKKGVKTTEGGYMSYDSIAKAGWTILINRITGPRFTVVSD